MPKASSNIWGEVMSKHIVSFSGGKDSTAMLLKMIEKDMRIDEIVFCDTGMEFPQMYKHLTDVIKYTHRNITVLKAEKSFEYYLGSHIKKNKGVGYGFPDFKNRWCTTLMKQNLMRKYCKNSVEYHGIAFDEKHRADKNKTKRNIKYPLIDWKMTEKDCLEYCYKEGFNWGGLYEKFNRVSCWCCPLQRIGELKTLYNEFPKLWKELQRLDKLSYRKFRSDYSVDELTKRFESGGK